MTAADPTAENPPGAGPVLGKDALLDAASLLFDSAGVDAVSVNQIVRASGHLNRSAIIYHFGSKDDVVRALVERSMVAPDGRRTQLLDDLLANDPHPTIEAITMVVVQPLSDQLETIEGRRHLRLLGHLLGHPRLLASAQAVFRGSESLVRCAALLATHVTHLPDDIRDERQALLVAFVMRAYADQARLVDAEQPARAPLSPEAFTAHLLGLTKAMLDAPVPGT